MDKIGLTQENLGILVTCATRYAIGRHSYMPYLVTGPLMGRSVCLEAWKDEENSYTV